MVGSLLHFVTEVSVQRIQVMSSQKTSLLFAQYLPSYFLTTRFQPITVKFHILETKVVPDLIPVLS